MSRDRSKALDAAERLNATCDVLAGFVDLGYDSFVGDTQTKWAVEIGLIRLGQEVSRIPPDVRARSPDQPWRVIIDMRNMAAHQYDALTARLVWKTLCEDIPALREYVEKEMIPALHDAAAEEQCGSGHRTCTVPAGFRLHYGIDDLMTTWNQTPHPTLNSEEPRSPVLSRPRSSVPAPPGCARRSWRRSA